MMEGAMGSMVGIDTLTSRFFDGPVCDGGVGGAVSRDQTSSEMTKFKTKDTYLDQSTSIVFT
jgi:hypothetical protein